MRVLVSAKARTVAVPAVHEVAAAFPDAPRVSWRGEEIVCLPHDERHTLALREAGLDVPAPIETRYDWRGGAPFDVQRRTAAALTLHPRFYVLSGMGTGKTRSALWAADWLMQQGEVRRVLVVSPLSTLHVVWRNEIASALPGRTALVLHGTAARRKALLAMPADFYIINYDGLVTMAESLAARDDLDLVILDELSMLRTPRTRRWHAALAVTKGRARVWGLTGSPTPQAPTDAWAQARVVAPASCSVSWGRFRDITMRRVTAFRWEPREGAAETVAALLQPSVRFSLDDVAELPPVVHVRREVEIAAEARAVYRALFSSLRATVGNGASITAANAGVQVNKLLQVSCGLVYDDDRVTQDFGCGSRYDVVRETIEQAEGKVIVFVSYLHALHDVCARLSADGIPHSVVHGDVGASDRVATFSDFQRPGSSVRVLVAHPKTMAHGVTLTAANTIIWYCPAPSFEVYEQANARVRRPGQSRRQVIVECVGTRAEALRYTQLREKQSLQDAVLALLSQEEG